MLYTENNMYEIDTDEPSAKRLKHEGNDSQLDWNLNFSISAEELDTLNTKRVRAPRDPTLHRIIEKRRRDRMNNCLGDLSKLIPTHYSKQGQGRIEKTEIIEMAIKLIKSLQNDVQKNESEKGQDPMCLTPLGENAKPCCISKFYMGFKECQDEVMRFLVENEDNNASDQVCVCMMEYLGKASKKFLPTVGRVKEDSDYVSSSSHQSRMTSRGSSHSSSPSSAGGNHSSEMTENNVQIHLKNRDVTSDSGYTNMGSAFSSMSLPLEMCRPEGMQYSSNAVQDFNSNFERSSTSSCYGQNNYNFKHNITKRFSEEQKVQQSEKSSSSSHEEQNIDMARRRSLKPNTRNYSADSTPYPSSSDGSYNQALQHISDKSSEGSSPVAYSSNINMYLPGFVLHPSGTHYFPLSIHSANVPDSSLCCTENPSIVFHPISIPVRFCGPHIPMGVDVQNPTQKPYTC